MMVNVQGTLAMEINLCYGLVNKNRDFLNTLTQIYNIYFKKDRFFKVQHRFNRSKSSKTQHIVVKTVIVKKSLIMYLSSLYVSITKLLYRLHYIINIVYSI